MYSDLRNKGVEISGKSMFDDALLAQEVNEKYPADSDAIFKFVKYTRFAMTFATILISLILILGYLLLKYR